MEEKMSKETKAEVLTDKEVAVEADLIREK